jgi:hypothetical protein
MNVQTTVVDAAAETTTAETMVEGTFQTVAPPANFPDAADVPAKAVYVARIHFAVTTPGTKSASTCAKTNVVVVETMEGETIQTETMDALPQTNRGAADAPARNASATPTTSVANLPGMMPASKNAPIAEAAEAPIMAEETVDPWMAVPQPMDPDVEDALVNPACVGKTPSAAPTPGMISVSNNVQMIVADAEVETTGEEMETFPMAVRPTNNPVVVDANAKAVFVPLIHSAANSVGMKPALVNAPTTVAVVETMAEASVREMVVARALDPDAADAHVRHASAN